MKKYPKLKEGIFAVQYDGANSKELLAEIESFGIYQDEGEAKYFMITNGITRRFMFVLDYLIVFATGDFEVMNKSDYRKWFDE